MDEVDADPDEDAAENAEDGDEQNADMGGYERAAPCFTALTLVICV